MALLIKARCLRLYSGLLYCAAADMSLLLSTSAGKPEPAYRAALYLPHPSAITEIKGKVI